VALSLLPQLRDDDARVVALMRDSPAIKEALAEQNAAVTLRRKTAIGEIARLDRQMTSNHPMLQDAIDAALAGVRAAEETLSAAQAQYARALGARQNSSISYQTKRDRLEAELRQTAGDIVQTFCSEMIDRLTATRKAFAWTDARETHPLTGKVTTRHSDNRASVQRRVDAINAAIETARELAVTEPDPFQVAVKIATLRAALPAVSSDLLERTE